ncbi:MAG: proton-conducting transporter membrane subunit [Lachnospiraceae bacterium]|nr:proton-conducting transporter membrane subunit [Lachnospiraceae bacterium]
MNQIVVILPVLLPFVLAVLVQILPFSGKKTRNLFVFGAVTLNSLLVVAAILLGGDRISLLHLVTQADIAFRVDGMAKVFAGLLAGLWPLASLYAFEYMEHAKKQETFFAWYVCAYGAAVGIAFSANLVTMYLFYEALTLITLPLIMHEGNQAAIGAGRKYLMYSVGGAAFGFMAVMILLSVAGTTEFAYGGYLPMMEGLTPDKIMLIRAGYVMAFMGFGVKTAVWPLHDWLPTAGVAPTPVTALLHAVAVVKAGVFALMRVTFFGFGTKILDGSWAQYTVMAFVFFTIVFGSSRALKEQHFKRRLAYSTVANLSYILLGVVMMTPEGLTAGLAHMLFHGVMKIVLFFAAGSVLENAHREYIFHMRGLGRKMPVTFGCFAFGSLALIGVPGMCGFVSKYLLAQAAVKNAHPFALVGLGALMISAVLTAIYTVTVMITAFSPISEHGESAMEEAHEAGWRMLLPMLLLCVAMVVLGLFSSPLIGYLAKVSAGLC